MPDYLNILIRSILSYMILFSLTRLMGKREIAQLTFFDYVVGISIGSIAANMTLNLNNDFYEMIPALVVFALFQLIHSILALKSKIFRKVTEGVERLLIENGKILEKNLTKERVNLDELHSMLRQKNVFQFSDVAYAYLETNGQLSVMKKKEQQSLTPKDLKMIVETNGVGFLVIEDGKVNEDKLKDAGITKTWLSRQLNEQGIQKIDDVLLAQFDGKSLYIDLYDA